MGRRTMELVTRPYCPHCGSIRPVDRTEASCVPCANQGSNIRLVTDESDRCTRFARWMVFWSEQGFTKEEIHKIPIYRNLIGNTFSRIHRDRAGAAVAKAEGRKV